MAKAVKKTVRKKTTKNNFFKFVKWFWILFVTGVLVVAFIFFLASQEFFGKMPSYEHLENPNTNLASQIISSDGELLGKFYLDDNRTPAGFEDLPKSLVQALIATEDARYYEHSGIDLRATIRAAIYLGSKGGASTISQQLARQLFVGVRLKNKFDAVRQKIMEWILAIRLERGLYQRRNHYNVF